jgi:O-antigen/teichoic acid export membrane protein
MRRILSLFERLLNQEIAASHSLKQVILNSGWLFSEKIIRMLFGMVVSVYVARYLGPERLGMLNYAVSFVAMFGVLTALGLDNIVVRELVTNTEERDTILGTAFALKLIGSVGVILLISVVLLVMRSDDLSMKMILLVAIALVFQCFGVVDFYFQSQVLSKYTVKIQLVQLVVSSLVKVSLVIFSAPLIYFGFALLADAAVLALGFIFAYTNRRMEITRWRFDRGIAARLLESSWPLIISGIFISIHMRIDQIMLYQLTDARQVGIYSISVSLTSMFYFVSSAMLTSIFPGLISAKSVSEEKYHLRLQQVYDVTAVLSISLAAVISFSSPYIIGLLYGETYKEAASVLSLYVWVMLIMTSSMVWGKWLLIENLQKYQMAVEPLVALAVVLGNFMLISRYGARGAAMSVLFGNFIVFLVLAVFFKNLRQGSLKLIYSLLMPGFSHYVLYKRKRAA